MERMSNGITVVPLDPLKNKITEIKFIFNLCKNKLTEKKKKWNFDFNLEKKLYKIYLDL